MDISVLPVAIVLGVFMYSDLRAIEHRRLEGKEREGKGGGGREIETT